MTSRFAVIDFETTGLSPSYGDRITEVAVVIIETNKIVDQFQSLVNTGESIPFHIQRLTGITNQMISTAPSSSLVMPKLYEFVKNATLVAHNASFDSKFFYYEMLKAGIRLRTEFICTLLLSRRLYPFLENLKLATLAAHHGIQYQGRSHRALADALVTADLLIQINKDLKLHLASSSITPQKLISYQREPLSNFSHIARKLKLQRNIKNLRS
jgi:DNA polymerase-3 subunit epsilon